MSFIEHNKDGLIYMSSDQIAARHAFTTRYGGVSQGDFASLNLGANRGTTRRRCGRTTAVSAP